MNDEFEMVCNVGGYIPPLDCRNRWIPRKL